MEYSGGEIGPVHVAPKPSASRAKFLAPGYLHLPEPAGSLFQICPLVGPDFNATRRRTQSFVGCRICQHRRVRDEALSEYEIRYPERLVHVGGGNEVSSNQRLPPGIALERSRTGRKVSS